MTPILSIGKARRTFKHWLLGENGETPKTAQDNALEDEPASESEDASAQRTSQFIEELDASSEEWLGRVRMVNLDSIRERVGPTWPKLQGRVEILAEKVIKDGMAGRDRYMKVGSAKFVVFFAETSPEESRIRCFAIVEEIHEKLFGFDEPKSESGHRVAECHVIHRDDLASKWEAAGLLDRTVPCNQSSPKPLRGTLRHDAEFLTRYSVLASAQKAIDSIIMRCAESQSIGELAPLLTRLQRLSQNLKTIEPALIAATKVLSESVGGTYSDHAGGQDKADRTNATQLGTTWEDIAEVISILDVDPKYSHADLLEALGKLRRSRLERVTKTFAVDGTSAVRSSINEDASGHFDYAPIYRSISQGERIHRGIYRVNYCIQKGANITADDDLIRQPHQEAMISERAILEHSIQYLSDRRTSAKFMLMAPVHIETLRGPHSRMRHSVILRSANLRTKRRLLIEIVGYCDTDDTIGIRRAIDELRVQSHAVFITLSHKSIGNLEKIVPECKKSGVHALGIDVSQFNGQNTGIVDAIIQLSSLGERYSIPTFVDGISNVSILGKAVACNARYICAPTLRPPLQTPGDAERTTLEDLYLAV